VQFVGSPVHAFVDSDNAVTESDETNNYGSSAPACVFTPSTLPFSPVKEWGWETSSVLPDYHNVMMTPVVADLDGDGAPEVLFTSFLGGNYGSDGILRAVSGADGREAFSVTDTAHRLTPSASLAVGDIDRDGLPEIVACQPSRLIAFEHDGTFKWQNPTSPVFEGCGWGGPALADLDGDGSPEIVVGRQVFNASGTLRWTGTGGRSGVYGPLLPGRGPRHGRYVGDRGG
jgi:hypothetical protein